jgi:hypothetical protein
MSDYQSPYHLTAEQQLADLQKHVADHQARGELQFVSTANDFKKAGSERFGDATFQKACEGFDAKLGNRAREVAAYLLEQDNAPDILMHLDNNPHELENLRNLPAQRAITELGRISNRLDSSTRLPAGPEPTWKSTASSAAQEVEARWHRDAGDQIKTIASGMPAMTPTWRSATQGGRRDGSPGSTAAGKR